MKVTWLAMTDGLMHAWDVSPVLTRRGRLCDGGNPRVFLTPREGQPKCFRCIIEETLWNEKLNASGPGKRVQTESATHGERPS